MSSRRRLPKTTWEKLTTIIAAIITAFGVIIAPGKPTITPGRDGPRQNGSVSAPYMEEAPVIDGLLEEWNRKKNPLEVAVFGEKFWNGLDDLSGILKLGWDEKYLYLGINVRDDIYVQKVSGKNLFKGDSLEILLDSDLYLDYHVSHNDEDDYQLGISPGTPSLGKNPEAYLWFPKSREGRRSKVEIGVQRSSSGYFLETAIPWSTFKITPAEGQHYGFVFSISDNDNQNLSVQQTLVTNIETRKLGDPLTWGDLYLVAP
jgi:hypothetical protein